MRILDFHHGSQLTKQAMAWQQRVQNASAPWRKDKHDKPQARWSRSTKDRQPTWEQINELKKRIDTLTSTASVLSPAPTPCPPTKEAEADKARLASLKRMKAEASNPEDQNYLDSKISELTMRLSRRLPLHDRLKLAREKCEAATLRLERNQAHLQRARTSLEAARANHAACLQEIEAVQAEVATDVRGGQPASQQASSQALQQAAKALRHLASMAMQNNGTVHFSAELLADVGSVIDSMPDGCRSQPTPAPRTAPGSTRRTPGSTRPTAHGASEGEACDVDFDTSLDAGFDRATGSAAHPGSEEPWNTVGGRRAMNPFSRMDRGRARADPYSTPATARTTRRSRTRSA